jgi:hypothetical protein
MRGTGGGRRRSIDELRIKIMTLRPITLTALLLGGLALTGSVLAEEPGAATVAQPENQSLDPAAIQALAHMGNYLRGLRAFSLQANDSTEEILESGQKVQLLKTVELQARKPDRLRVDVVTDRKAREIFYDGKSFTLLAPETGYYATVAAPPTIGEMLTAVEAKYGIELPLADLFRWGEDTDAAAAIQAALVVGTSKIAGQVADHYAFRQADIDSLPPSCSMVQVGGVAYQQCGSTWYQPRYAGTSVQYVVVNSPY